MATKKTKPRRGNQTEEGTTHLREEFLRYYCGQARFCATKALRMATGDPKATRQSASEMLNSPAVQAALDKRIFELRECIPHIFADLVRTDLDILKTSPFDVVDPKTGGIRSKIPRFVRNSISEITVKEYEGGRSIRVKPYDKGAASTRLSKILGLLAERDPLEDEREQLRDAGAIVTGRISGLRARLVPKQDPAEAGADGVGAEGSGV